MSAIGAIGRTATGSGFDQGALGRALRDPRVRQLARAMNLNLSDEQSVADLIKRNRKAAESSVDVTLHGAAPDVMARGIIQDSYARNAVRVYQQIASFR